MPTPQAPQDEPSYYDVSLLKAPVWKWEVASYFFLGGMSAGAYILSRVAERVGGEAYRDLTRAGAFTAFAALLPCPPLLIHDLGDPKRFHHMLRIWKPSTPMNVGTWTLTAYSGPATLAALREWVRGRPRAERGALAKLANPVLVAVEDAAGIPLALMLMGYTGVLLSCTSNPLWCKNPWLGPLFSASAISVGASAVSLALRLGGTPEGAASLRALGWVDTASHAVETVSGARFLACAGERAEPLTRGRRAPVFWGGGAMAVTAETLKFLPLRGRAGRWAKIAASVLSLGAGFCTRWSIVHAGRDAAEDPRLARSVSRPKGTGAAALSTTSAARELQGRADLTRPASGPAKRAGVLGT